MTNSMVTTQDIVSFRELSNDIRSTTYASHGMYYHPAKFIPQIVSWFIKNYTKENDWIIDPFGGVGTLAVECLINNRNAICLDLNPIIENFILAKTYKAKYLFELEAFEERIVCSNEYYYPKWSRIAYWYHPEILNVLVKMWGGYYKSPHPLGLLALFKTSRRFSYADDQVPKIFISRMKKNEIDGSIIKNDFIKIIREYFKREIRKLVSSSLEFSGYYTGGEYIARGGIDLPSFELDRKVNHMITSPPYGRAHEYIRSFKLELAWLGYDDKQISELISKEIPYRRITEDIGAVEIQSETYEKYRRKVADKYIRDYECYFKSVIKGLEKVMTKINGYAGIFVGNATYGGIEPPYHDIFIEHFNRKGFVLERTLVDRIVSRRLFKGRMNMSPNGIESEYLVILKAP